MTSEFLLIYDGDCAFCTRCVSWGEQKLDAFPRAIASQSLTDDLLASFGLTRKQVLSEVYLIGPGERKFGGARAVEHLLKYQVKLFWRLTGQIMGFGPIRPLASLIYKVVAKNRHRLPGATEACEMDNT